MTTRAISHQLRLPGQAAAPDGPIDVSTMYFMHFGFRRDLDAFVTASRTPVTDRARWDASAEADLDPGFLPCHMSRGATVGEPGPRPPPAALTPDNWALCELACERQIRRRPAGAPWQGPRRPGLAVRGVWGGRQC